jgi:hypothetical protein
MSIYKKTDSGAARLDNDLSLTWIKLGELAGNHSKTKTITVIDTSQYHELLLTCGPAVEYQTRRILASTIIPITGWLGDTTDHGNGAFQAAYSTTHLAGVSRISNTSIKLYANTATLTAVYIR